MKAVALLLLACVGCDSQVFGPDIEYLNRRPLHPIPDWYAAEYALVEECVGHAGDFDAVLWYVADVLSLENKRLAGVVEFPNDITFAAAHYTKPPVVRHEIEHHVRQQGDEIHLPNGETPCAEYVSP